MTPQYLDRSKLGFSSALPALPTLSLSLPCPPLPAFLALPAILVPSNIKFTEASKYYNLYKKKDIYSQ
ncbi:hypothetical protein RclHR1_13610012 [Rhizophagus clarus]|uniref:Uncharacterized protein n=1 Tax=Rhizophagus clarus TaxID=94130 RepID=A0A2Z6QQE5_9GLOM|nr:hypothetical protein RclHR1_13610012 [Rhizophagus clarus]